MHEVLRHLCASHCLQLYVLDHSSVHCAHETQPCVENVALA